MLIILYIILVNCLIAFLIGSYFVFLGLAKGSSSAGILVPAIFGLIVMSISLIAGVPLCTILFSLSQG